MLFFLTILFSSSCSTKPDRIKWTATTNSSDTTLKGSSLDGFYTGLEEMCWTDSTGKKDCYGDPADPKWTWYHLGNLKIIGDSVFLDQSPICIYKNDTTFSASDGAFYYYSGTVEKHDTNVLINLTELFCDYCPVHILTEPNETEEVIKRKKLLRGIVHSKGIVINGYLYRKELKKESLISEHPQAFL